MGSAVAEWDIIDCEEDERLESSCICGKEDLRFLFTIQKVACLYQQQIIFRMMQKYTLTI